MLGTLFTLPTSSAIITNTGAYSSGMFDELLPVAYVVIGVMCAVLVVRWIVKVVLRALRKLFGRK